MASWTATPVRAIVNMATDPTVTVRVFTQDNYIPANTKHLYDICTMLDQRRRRWASVVQMLYKCVVFSGIFLVMSENR